MELKDVILSTLAELDEIESTVVEHKKQEFNEVKKQEIEISFTQTSISSDEKQFLESIQERLLVLFEGFQAPNNIKIEAKVDLTLNFLEYLLASVENRINLIDHKEK
ncbi:MAG: hypothetical protein PHX13_06835 [Thiovulaceae bacterium]|nr:hypothetical protein [Sulfurimonadaceae bacterium]